MFETLWQAASSFIIGAIVVVVLLYFADRKGWLPEQLRPILGLIAGAGALIVGIFLFGRHRKQSHKQTEQAASEYEHEADAHLSTADVQTQLAVEKQKAADAAQSKAVKAAKQASDPTVDTELDVKALIERMKRGE